MNSSRCHRHHDTTRVAGPKLSPLFRPGRELRRRRAQERKVGRDDGMLNIDFEPPSGCLLATLQLSGRAMTMTPTAGFCFLSLARAPPTSSAQLSRRQRRQLDFWDLFGARSERFQQLPTSTAAMMNLRAQLPMQTDDEPALLISGHG